MYFYWVVYSLTANANKYLDMFCIAYTSLLQNNVINDSDTAILLCDAETATKAQYFKCLSKVKKVIVPKPKTHLEGMLYRYRLHEYFPLVDGDVCMSLDVDMITIRRFRIECPKDTILAYPEGNPADPNYCGDMTLTTPHGCSATVFCYSFSQTIKALLDSVKGEKIHYTLDGPYYNKALEQFKNNVAYLPKSMLSFNGHYQSEQTLFINLAGEPGDETLHWTKMLDCLMLLNIRSRAI
jgi:hypothetical protein